LSKKLPTYSKAGRIVQKLRELAAEVSAAEVSEALARIRTAVREAGLSAGVVDDALREVRSR
jgi:hypothetical protein